VERSHKNNTDRCGQRVRRGLGRSPSQAHHSKQGSGLGPSQSLPASPVDSGLKVVAYRSESYHPRQHIPHIQKCRQHLPTSPDTTAQPLPSALAFPATLLHCHITRSNCHLALPWSTSCELFRGLGQGQQPNRCSEGPTACSHWPAAPFQPCRVSPLPNIWRAPPL